MTIALAPDPDVEIREVINGREVLKVALEIKGGTDYANIHNRAGEAEKSHQKARNRHASAFWTVIATTGKSITVQRSRDGALATLGQLGEARP